MKDSETKCKCNNLQNGDIIRTDDDGKCIVCGFQYLRATPPETKVEVTEHADGTIRANGIKIFPPETSSWASAFDATLEKIRKACNNNGLAEHWALSSVVMKPVLEDFIRSVATSEYKRGRKDERDEKEKEWHDFNQKLMS